MKTTDKKYPQRTAYTVQELIDALQEMLKDKTIEPWTEINIDVLNYDKNLYFNLRQITIERRGSLWLKGW